MCFSFIFEFFDSYIEFAEGYRKQVNPVYKYINPLILDKCKWFLRNIKLSDLLPYWTLDNVNEMRTLIVNMQDDVFNIHGVVLRNILLYYSIELEVNGYLGSDEGYVVCYTVMRSYFSFVNVLKFLARNSEGHYVETVGFYFFNKVKQIFGDKFSLANFFEMNEDSDYVTHCAIMVYIGLITRFFTFSSPIMSAENSDEVSACINYSLYDNEDLVASLSTISTLLMGSAGVAINLSLYNWSSAAQLITYLKMLENLMDLIGHTKCKRKCAIAVYMNVENEYILNFLGAKHPLSNDEICAKKLNYGVLVNNKFMNEWENLYGKSDVGDLLLSLMVLTGQPYIVNIERMNENSLFNEPIELSNLCTEIAQPSSKCKLSICTLAVVNVAHEMFSKTEYIVPFVASIYVALQFVIENRIKSKKDGFRLYNGLMDRNVGIGICGAADVIDLKLVEMRLQMISNICYFIKLVLFQHLSETYFNDHSIYYDGILCKVDNCKYHSPACRIDYKPSNIMDEKLYEYLFKFKNFRFWTLFGDMYKWSSLIAIMPTVSSSVWLDVNENIEPYMNFSFLKSTTLGNFIMIPFQIYLTICTAYNYTPKNKVDLESYAPIRKFMSQARTYSQYSLREHIEFCGRIQRVSVDQSISLNFYFEKISTAKIHGALMLAHANKLKTLKYYNYEFDKVYSIYENECSSCLA